MAKVRPSEIIDLTSALEKFGQNSATLEKKILKAIDSGKNLSNSVVKELAKIEKRVLHQQISIRKEIDKLAKSYDKLSDQERERLQNLKEQYQEGDVALKTLEKLSGATESLTAKTKALGVSLGLAAVALKAASMSWGLFKGAINLVVKAYDNWFRLEQNWMTSMSSLRMEHGLTMDQARQAQIGVEELRETYGDLTSEVDGIAITSQYMGEIRNAVRMAGEEVNTFGGTLAAIRHISGITGDSLNTIFRLVTTGAPDASAAMEEWFLGIEDLADQISVPVGALRQDFIESSSEIARFGNQGMEAFRNASTMAARFGMQASKILQMVKKFDSFQSGSDSVNQLNAMLGTSISSFELMMETDPTARLERIRQSVMDTGQSWGEMNRYQRDAIAGMLDIPVDEAARLFQDNISFAQLEQEREITAAAQHRDERLRIDNTQRLNDMLRSTQAIMEDWGRTIQRIWNILSQAISPIFREVFDITSKTREEFVDWVKQLSKTSEFKEGIREIAVSIRDTWSEIVDWVKESDITFEDVKEKAGDIWDIMKGIGTAVKDMWDSMSGFVRLIRFAAESYKALKEGDFDRLGSLGAEALFDEDGNFSNELARTILPENIVQNISRIDPQEIQRIMPPAQLSRREMEGLSAWATSNPFIAQSLPGASSPAASAPSLDRTTGAQLPKAAAAPIININVDNKLNTGRLLESIVDTSIGR